MQNDTQLSGFVSLVLYHAFSVHTKVRLVPGTNPHIESITIYQRQATIKEAFAIATCQCNKSIFARCVANNGLLFVLMHFEGAFCYS